MGFFRRVGRAFRRITRPFKSLAKGALNLATKPFSMVAKLTAPLTKIAGKILNKLPFGRFVAPFVQQFLSNPMAFMAGGPLGMFGMLAGEAANGKGGGISGLLSMVTKGLGGPLANLLSPQALNNVANLSAHAHASRILKR